MNGIDRIEPSREVELEDPRFDIFCSELNGVREQVGAQVYKLPTHEVFVPVDDDDIGRRLTSPSIAYLLGQELSKASLPLGGGESILSSIHQAGRTSVFLRPRIGRFSADRSRILPCNSQARISSYRCEARGIILGRVG